MIFLLFSILSSTAIQFLFKVYAQKEIPVFQTIVINYFVCVLTGGLTSGAWPDLTVVVQQLWFPHAAFLSFFFVSGFTIMALTVKYWGVTVSAVAAKMSILLSVPFAIWFYQEELTIWSGLGILLALASIILSSWPDEDHQIEGSDNRPFWALFLPILSLVISGIIEIVLQYVEVQLAVDSGSPLFVVSLFLFAGSLGLIFLILGLITSKIKFDPRALVAGGILGFCNYFSIYLLMKSIGIGLPGSIVFPVNNVAIIALSAIGALFLFAEPLKGKRLVGFILALVAIGLLAIGAG